MQGEPAVPEGVLLQMLVVDPRGREAGYRIYDDGRFERRSVGGAWVSAPALTTEQQQAARAAIRSAGLERLEPRYEPATREVDDGNSVLHVDASDGGARRSVAVVRPCKVAEVDALIARMDEILKQR